MENEIRSDSNSLFAGHILCGDFNLESFSPIYNFIINSKLNLSFYSPKDLPIEILKTDDVPKVNKKSQINLSSMKISSSCVFKGKFKKK